MGSGVRGSWDEELRAPRDRRSGRDFHGAPRDFRRVRDARRPGARAESAVVRHPGVVGPRDPLVLYSAPHRRDDGRDPPRRFDGPDAREGDSHPRVLDRDHRDRCHACLDDHQLLHHQVLEPALQGSQRAPEEGSSVTELIRSDAPRRSAMAALALGGLIIGILWFSILTVIIALQDLSGISDSQTDSYMALFMGMVFLLLAFAIDIYRE